VTLNYVESEREVRRITATMLRIAPLVILATAVGCGSPSKPTHVANHQAGAAKAAASNYDELRYLPATSRAVIHADLATIRTTPFGVKADAFLAGVLSDAGAPGDAGKVTAITWALAGEGETSRQVMVVRGPTADDVLAWFAQGGSDKLRLEHDGPLARVIFPDGEQVTFAYPEDRTIVFFMFESKPADADLRKLVSDGAPLRASPEFMSRFGAVSGGQVWGITNSNPHDLAGPLAAVAIPSLRGDVRAATVEIQVTDRIAVQADFDAADAKGALELVANARADQADKSTLAGELLALAPDPQVNAGGPTVYASFSLTADQLSLARDAWARAIAQAGK
jgi:hypothetical protein